MDDNRLQTDGLQTSTLQNLTRLQYLFLNHNKLTAVPSGLPSSLRQLRLAHNLITSISPGTFGNLHNLTLLLLQGNRLNVITETDFTGLVSLNLLDLSGNLFSSFPSHLPPSIQQLYLSNNSLSALGEESLWGFTNLRQVISGTMMAVHSKYCDNSQLEEMGLKFNVSSFCREVGPLSYSRMRILRLDGNKMSYHLLPPEWVYCLRVLHHIYI
ncbi:unnamed protein product [Coregonus sp. 'balchen']|nr:unnamed protein product [Coregonus sp. 'balchen']